jgi:D-alanine-D-alanine ligase
MLSIPYTGAGPACLAICYNKALVRSLADSLDIPVPLETYVDPSDQAATLPSIFPALIKPNYGDSSIGITQEAVVHSAEELICYSDKMKQLFPGRPFLVQEYLSGREFSVSVVGNPGNFEILPILEVDFSHLPKNLPQILSYESKWLPDSPYWTDIRYKLADLNDEVVRQLSDYSTQLFERLECRDYARFDFREDAQGVVKLLEVNPNPGWCWDGKFNLMASFRGLQYQELLEMILSAAKERLGIKNS